MRALLGYAERAGSVVHIREVPSGLACDCRCLNCGEPLIARKGSQRVHHFSHTTGAECAGALEGTLHRLAKHLLTPGSPLWLPEYYWKRRAVLKNGEDEFRTQRLFDSREVMIADSRVEHRSPSDFVPDVALALRNGEQLFVEIIVSHPVDHIKRRKIRRHGVATLKIKLQPEDALLSPLELKAKLLGQRAEKEWCFHPSELPMHREFLRNLRTSQRRLRAHRRSALKPFVPQATSKPTSK